MKVIKGLLKPILQKLGYEVRRIPNAPIGSGLRAEIYDYQKEAEDKIALIKPYTMVTEEALITLYQQVRYCEKNDIPGHFVECGVWKGGAVGLMALANLAYGRTRRHIYCFDVFDDICEPDPTIDGKWAIEQIAQLSGADPKSFVGALKPVKGVYASRGGPGSIKEVKDLLEGKIGYPREYLHYCEGWFQDTLPVVSKTIGEIAILRLDCDWYASTKVCLDWLYDKVVEDGFIIVDDYGTYEGCRKAVDEFLTLRRAKVFLHHVNRDCRYWIK